MKNTEDKFWLFGCSYKLLWANFAFLVTETNREILYYCQAPAIFRYFTSYLGNIDLAVDNERRW